MTYDNTYYEEVEDFLDRRPSKQQYSKLNTVFNGLCTAPPSTAQFTLGARTTED